MDKIKAQNLLPRPSIVVVMGHVDHGKTTLLDFIRKANVAGKEAGGITQSIGAYEIIHSNKRITFIDTPGHEAFFKMRARGARAADLAILVVAADDGVKPQTKEVINVLQETNTPFIVAINKIDKNNADIEKTKNDLMQNGVMLEGYGGNISWQGISAKTGEGINELLDLILLTAEVEGLTYDAEGWPQGFIIEARMDSRRGLTVMAIVKNGCLKVGSEIKTNTASGKVKILEDFLGKRVKELWPSSPAMVLGFEILPQVGEIFCGSMGELEVDASIIGKKDEVPWTASESGEEVINIFLKGDVSGSLEAISGIIRSTFEDVRIIQEGIGEITDGDVKNASSNHSLIIGFKAKATKAAENVARAQEVEIISSEIIYELLKKIEEKVESLKRPKPDGELDVLAVFSQKGRKQLIGGKVSYGLIKNNIRVKIGRGEEEIGMGRIINLQKGKQEAVQVGEGEECGIMFDSDIVIQAGDKIIYQP